MYLALPGAPAAAGGGAPLLPKWVTFSGGGMAAPEEETPRLPEDVNEEEELEVPDPDFDPEAETNPEYSPPPPPPRPRPKRPKDMAARNGGQLRGQAFLQTTFFSSVFCTWAFPADDSCKNHVLVPGQNAGIIGRRSSRNFLPKKNYRLLFSWLLLSIRQCKM